MDRVGGSKLAAGDQLTPPELQLELEAVRRGIPFLAFRDDADNRRIVPLAGRDRSLTVGRDPGCDIAIGWDREVSALHAQLDRLGDHWVLADDGLSRNGTWVNGERVTSRRRLRDGDDVRCGRTTLTFRDPRASQRSTAVGPEQRP
jgi:pSer/pThr/pTyr-binding forkhead associated (FHA) protein